jgi:serine phosphatase RsbU (regulator of sigma subunit)
MKLTGGKGSQLTKFDRYSLVSLTLAIVGSLISWLSPNSMFSLLQDLGFILMVPVVAVYIVRLFKWLKAKILFTVRNKILISYIFIGGVPLGLLMIAFFIAILLIFKQISGVFLQNELDDINGTLENINTHIILSDPGKGPVSGEFPDTFFTEIQAALNQAPSNLQGYRTRVFYNPEPDQGTKFLMAAELSKDSIFNTEKISAPEWLSSDFSGFLAENGTLYLTVISRASDNLILVTQIPVNEKIIMQIENNTYFDVEMVPVNEEGFAEDFEYIYQRLSEQSSLFSVLGVHFIRPIEWSSGAPISARPILISVPVRILFIQLFSQSSRIILILLYVLGGIYLLTVLASIIAGAKITRGITRSINEIYIASEQVQKGEFDFRIQSENHDQLEIMADSFNELSTGIKHLMGEVAKRERLEKEIEIAREVQIQLLPQDIPQSDYLKLAASCLPAQRVGGDYYDFIRNADSLDLVIGDIAGKGISAALLMASTMATIHHTLNEKNYSDQVERMISVAEEVNSQVFLRSAANAYSTLVIASYNENKGTLTYCNAGHQPPIMISNGIASELNIGGTAIGLFPQWQFTADTINLKPGDTIVFFTDGVVEAANQDDEFYGNDQLLQLVMDNIDLDPETLRSKIIESVMEWAGDEPQGDDITLICLKVQ